MKITANNLEETAKIAQKFTDDLKKGVEKATVVGLYGDLGSGKTAFVKKLAFIFGIKDDITSPTFVIIKKYSIDFKGFKNFVHIDAYRLDGGYELEAIGWKEMLDNPENLIFIEWPEKVSSVIPNDIRKIKCLFIDENTREFEFDFLKLD